MKVLRIINNEGGYILQLIIALAVVGALSYGILSNFSGSVETSGNEIKTNLEIIWQAKPMTVD